MSEKKIFAIINPISGTSKKDNLDKKIMKMLSGNEVTIDIAYTEYSGHATLLAKEAVDKCQRADIINGLGDGRFGPSDNAMRCQGAVIFSKVLTERPFYYTGIIL